MPYSNTKDIHLRDRHCNLHKRSILLMGEITQIMGGLEMTS